MADKPVSPIMGLPPALLSGAYIPQVFPRVLGTVEMTSLFLLNVMWVTNITPITAGGPAGFTYWLFTGTLFFVPCSIVMAQLARLFPTGGGIYTWTYYALGPKWGFFVSICAWLPGILSMVNSAVAVISCVQALNPAWLQEPWQQGSAVLAVLCFVGIFSCQRTRLVCMVLGAAVIAMGIATVLIGGAALFWLLSGHPPMTNLLEGANWQPTGSNLALLGSTTLALMGPDMPLSMSAEVKSRKVIGRHLLWGTALALSGYLIFTFALLVLQGPEVAATTYNPMVLLIASVDQVAGPVLGNVMALCLLLYFLLIPVALNLCFARLLVVAGIDGRISRWFALLSRHRVPTRTLLFQTAVALFFTSVIYFLIPLFAQGNPADLTSIAYNVIGAGLLLVWSISFQFPFFDLIILWAKGGERMHSHRVFPSWLLAISLVTGPLFCLITIILTLQNSFLPTLIPNGSWWWVIGSFALMSLILCAIGSLLTNSQAAFEHFSTLEAHNQRGARPEVASKPSLASRETAR